MANPHLMEIVNVIFRNGYWHVLIVDSERIDYKVFFEGLETDTDEEIIDRAKNILLETEEKVSNYSKRDINQGPVQRETAKGKIGR